MNNAGKADAGTRTDPKGSVARWGTAPMRDERSAGSLPNEQQLFRMVVDTTPAMIWLSGADGGRIYVNKSWLTFTGRSINQELGMGWRQGVHPDDDPQCIETYLGAFHRQQGFQTEYRLRRADGEYRWLLDQGVPRFTEQGCLAGLMGSCVDITHCKENERALQAAHDDLERLARERMALLSQGNARLAQANIQHKLAKQKVIQQQSHLHMLVSELAVAEERQRHRIATGLHDQIGQTLALARLRMGELLESTPSEKAKGLVNQVIGLVDQAFQATRSATFDLSSPILYELGLEAAVQSFGEQIAAQAGFCFSFDADPIQKLLADNTRIILFRIIRELLFNIQKYADAHNVTVTLQADGDHLRVSIEDDGVGFNAAQIGSGFSPAGGFGLFSIRAQLTGIGGNLEITSSPASGTRVVVRMPAQRSGP